jgi:hypothetical protein
MGLHGLLTGIALPKVVFTGMTYYGSKSRGTLLLLMDGVHEY